MLQTPNPRVGDNEGVKDQITRTLREFGFTPKGWARSYQKPYLKYFDTITYPRGFRVPDLAKFTSDDDNTTYEHVGQFLAQVVTEPLQKWGVCLPRSYQGILDEARMRKHTQLSMQYQIWNLS
jgi:hypothetical protein